MSCATRQPRGSKDACPQWVDDLIIEEADRRHALGAALVTTKSPDEQERVIRKLRAELESARELLREYEQLWEK